MIPEPPILLRRSFAWLIVLALVVLVIVAAWAYGKTPDLRRGAALYAQHCASCHGARLEGQPDWQIAGADGVLPAPPHDETGHTWHHDDAMLTDYVRRGGQVLRGEAARTPTFDQLLLDGRRPGDAARPAADVASTTSEAWRVLRIQAEFVEGFGTLAGLGPAVSVFGSARTPEGSAEYALAHEVGSRLAQAGYTVITGGGPGTMAAANRGAHEAGGESVGLGIELPFEAGLNEWVHVGWTSATSSPAR